MWVVAARLHFLAIGASACTAFVVGKKATLDGTTITTHADDTAVTDSRVAYIAPFNAREREIYMQAGEYPRHVGTRSKVYEPTDTQEPFKPILTIPQDENVRTYGYYEAEFAYINEKGVTIGEATCGAKLWSNYTVGPLIDMAQLTQIALERCATSSCTVETMGKLGQKYGFKSEGPSFGEAGEAIITGDGNEAWVFHILSDGYKSAVWVAQRVPDDHIAVVPNTFIIRQVDCANKEYFRCSDNMYSVAVKNNLWKEDEPFDFTKVYGGDAMTTHYLPGFPPVPLYMSLRIWRVQSLAAPSRKIEARVNPLDYEFSVPVDKPLSLEMVRAITRDYYQDTEFDLTKGAFAGPFNSFFRMELGEGMHAVDGQFPRAINIARTNYGVIGQSRGDDPRSVCWFSADAPATAVYVPFFAKTANVYSSYTVGTKEKLDRASAWWGFNVVAGIAYPYLSVIKPDIDELVKNWETKIDQRLLLAGNDTAALEKMQTDVQREVTNDWWELSDHLLCKYNDGFKNEGAGKLGQHVGYPAAWLSMNGFDRDPRPKYVVPEKKLEALDAVLGHEESRSHFASVDNTFLQSPEHISASTPSFYEGFGAPFFTSLLVGIACLLLGFAMGQGCRTRSDSMGYVELAA